MRLPTLVLLLQLTSGAASRPADCTSLDACLVQLRAIAVRPGFEADSMTAVETELLERLRGFEGAVPRLVGLLADPDVRIANLAAKGLRDATYIDPAFLPQIVAGLDRDLAWLAPALGHMPSAAAAREAVARLLVSESAPHNQEAYAVQLSGGRAIPFIVEAARCARGCDDRVHGTLGYVLRQMVEVRALAGPGLMTLAEDDAATEQAARGALSMIAQLQEDGAPLERRLLALRRRRPPLAAAVDEALIGVRSPRAGAILAQRLQQQPEPSVLRDVAEAGLGARDAGPVVTGLLRHPDGEVRLGAARALGYIGYEAGAEALIPLLDDAADVRLAWAAAESLGRLRMASAEPALRHTAETHWLPAVRESAKRALAALRARVPSATRDPDENFAFEFFEYERLTSGMPSCRTPAPRAVKERGARKLHSAADAAGLAKLKYETTIVSYGPDEATLAAAKPGEVIEVTPQNMVTHRKVVPQTPDVALRVRGGWLVGADRGEWGGELVLLGDDGTRKQLLDENVQNIVQLGSRYVAVTGLAHMMSNRGMLYEVSPGEGGSWRARPWRALPGAPGASWMVKTGELLVSVGEGVPILVEASGSMRMAPCAQYDKDAR